MVRKNLNASVCICRCWSNTYTDIHIHRYVIQSYTLELRDTKTYINTYVLSPVFDLYIVFIWYRMNTYFTRYYYYCYRYYYNKNSNLWSMTYEKLHRFMFLKHMHEHQLAWRKSLSLSKYQLMVHAAFFTLFFLVC